jgi:hypothetical protein
MSDQAMGPFKESFLKLIYNQTNSPSIASQLMRILSGKPFPIRDMWRNTLVLNDHNQILKSEMLDLLNLIITDIFFAFFTRNAKTKDLVWNILLKYADTSYVNSDIGLRNFNLYLTLKGVEPPDRVAFNEEIDSIAKMLTTEHLLKPIYLNSEAFVTLPRLINTLSNPDLIKKYLKKAMSAPGMTKDKLLSTRGPNNFTIMQILEAKHISIESLDLDAALPAEEAVAH